MFALSRLVLFGSASDLEELVTLVRVLYQIVRWPSSLPVDQIGEDQTGEDNGDDGNGTHFSDPHSV